MSDIVTIISSVGFPIFASLAVGYFCKYLIDKYTNIMTTTMDNLTDAINELKDRINKLED